MTFQFIDDDLLIKIPYKNGLVLRSRGKYVFGWRVELKESDFIFVTF